MKFEESDLMELASSVKSAIELHEVNPKLQDSLLSDVLFQVANLIDEKQGSSFHEEIFELLDNFVPSQSDYLVCDLDIYLQNGECLETNVLKSDIEILDSLILNLEVLLELRDISEIDDIIDIDERFKGINIDKLFFKPLKDQTESYNNQFTNINDLAVFIKETASKWV